ncbi:proprotein convertase P-domain-containing protein [Crossiella cryophila]|uniref:Streptogrisin C n=1 Tax=Crossiella cryophila TaxID=43355 RepID=A0A7W7FQV9_9PSEU|nr:streptogrisin C [Crossiella cryophila]
MKALIPAVLLSLVFPASASAEAGDVVGKWIDPSDGQLVVSVYGEGAAEQVRQSGSRVQVVSRGRAELDGIVRRVGSIAAGPTGVTSWGIDPVSAQVVVRTVAAADADLVARIRGFGEAVRVVVDAAAPVQQAGEVRTGSPWWPGSETYCSVGFGATDSGGGKHFLTAGHCTNDANQAAYGQISQQNRVGTSNVGGSRSVNAREGDMGVVAVTEAGWALSPSVNTWGGGAVTVAGFVEPVVGQSTCHSGNTSKWQCGRVTAVNQTINYGSVVVEGLATTTACSKGGDSGGGWLVGDKAVGLHSGGQSSCEPGGADNQSIFQPVGEALKKWGLTLVTGDPGGDTEAPSVPGNLRATGVTSSSVALGWDAATDNVGVTGYDVYRGEEVVASSEGTSVSVAGLAADTEYSFVVRARDAAGNRSGASAVVTARTAKGDTGARTFSNGKAFAIRDFAVAVSPVRSTASGSAAAPVTVVVDAVHTCQEDLNITLVGPSGRYYSLQRAGGFECHAFPGTRTFTVRTSEQAGGNWTLRIGDNGPGDVGTLNSWSVTV